MTVKNKIQKRIKYLSLFLAIIVILLALVVGHFYKTVYLNNVNIKGGHAFLYINKTDDFEDVCVKLKDQHIVKNMESFIWVAKHKKYISRVKKGRYAITSGMSNDDLINMLRQGRQTPVNVTFNNMRTVEELSGRISSQLMLDSLDLLNFLKDNNNLEEFGFNKKTVPALFIPNTYEVYWDTDAEHFIKRMYKEYKHFWNEDRIEKAKKQGLSPIGVSILASIVDEETAKIDEKPKVAGLYLNRLKRHILLQADPTLKFAIGDFTIKRLLNKDKTVDSPYNTYIHAGLPPGPIRIPSINGINAVLNPAHHKYLYMCAKEDFSGYHNFARTLAEHNNNARRYQRELHKRGIRR